MVDISDTEKLSRLRLIRTPNIGPITFHHLMQQFGSAEKALERLPDLAKQGSRSKPLTIPSKAAATKEITHLEKSGYTILFHGDGAYPNRLAAIEDAPPLLIARGHVHLLKKDSGAIVGARNASANGHTIASRLAARLGEEGYITISGMARGIDTSAHKAALSAGTIACLAGGTDIIYPKENNYLYDEIADHGCLVSEMPLGTTPTARHFPRRNRIISGLSLAVIVVEAALRSGSLITARLAAEQGRDVLAVPGSPLDARSGGTNKLIKEGAALISSSDDVIEILNSLAKRRIQEPDHMPLFDSISPSDIVAEPEIIDRVKGLLGPNPCLIDEVIRQSGLPTGKVIAALLTLELCGEANRLSGQRIALTVKTW